MLVFDLLFFKLWQDWYTRVYMFQVYDVII